MQFNFFCYANYCQTAENQELEVNSTLAFALRRRDKLIILATINTLNAFAICCMRGFSA